MPKMAKSPYAVPRPSVPASLRYRPETASRILRRGSARCRSQFVAHPRKSGPAPPAPKQEATQTAADTTSTIATTGTATVYNLLKIKDKSGKAELAFRNVGKFEIKSPDGNDEGSFGMEDGKIVLTSQTGKKMNIGQDGKLEYVVGDQTYEFKFGEADLEKLAAVKK